MVWENSKSNCIDWVKTISVEAIRRRHNGKKTREQMQNWHLIWIQHEEEKDGCIPFCRHLSRQANRRKVCWCDNVSEMNTDQYWSFDSHHPLRRKLWVIRTLYDRCSDIVILADYRESEQNTSTFPSGDRAKRAENIEKLSPDYIYEVNFC